MDMKDKAIRRSVMYIGATLVIAVVVIVYGLVVQNDYKNNPEKYTTQPIPTEQSDFGEPGI